MGYTGSQSVYWSGLSEKDQYKTSVIAVNFDGISSLNPTVLMGLNAWQSEIFKVFTYLSFPQKRPFCTLIKLRRRNAKNSIAEFPIITNLCTVGARWFDYSENQEVLQPHLIRFLAVCSLFWLAVARLLSLSTVERQFICACSVNLARLMPETAGMRLCRFVSEEMKEHMPETTMDWVFETTFLETTFLVICSSVT